MKVMGLPPQENIRHVGNQLLAMARCTVNQRDTLVECTPIDTVAQCTQPQVSQLDVIVNFKYPNQRLNQDMSKQIYSSLVEVRFISAGITTTFLQVPQWGLIYVLILISLRRMQSMSGRLRFGSGQ